jgi:hypothetical protein
VTSGWPGNFATVELPAVGGAFLTVPDQAVIDTGFRRVVYVAAGNYSDVVGSFTSVYGGFDPVTWQRDILANATVVQASDTNTTAYAGGGHALQGLHIIAPADQTESYAIRIDGDAYVADNIIDGTGATLASYGINAGGEGARMLFINNVIDAGAGGSTGSYGLQIFSSVRALVAHNLIRSGTAAFAYGLVVKNTAEVAAVNNILLDEGATSGNLVWHTSTQPLVLQNSLMLRSHACLLYVDGACLYASIDDVNNCSTASCVGAVDGNISGDPGLDVDGIHLGGDSICRNAGAALAPYQLEAIPDIDGDPRPQGAAPDIGVDEAP